MKKIVLLLSLLVWCNFNASATMSLYDIKIKNITGQKEINFADFRGKIVMVVNTASLCGFTKQYAGLESLWREYQNKNFILVAVPTNDFGSQEPGSNQEIKDFCEVNFGITFPITEKVTSKGQNKHPIFQLISEKFPSKSSGPHWNFYKYIFDENGEPVDWFSSITKPNSKKILKIIDSKAR